jgi:Flp pilus assembly protein TadG/ribosomal protein L40E
MWLNKNKTRAQAMVEFSLVAALFFVLILGFIEFARYIHAKYTIIEAARMGASELAKADNTKSSEELNKLLRDTVMKNAASLNENSITKITYAEVKKDNSNFIKVAVDYNVKTITPISVLYRLLGASVDSSGDTVFPVHAEIMEKKEEISTKVCPNCGITVPGNAKYCPNCGTAL